MRAILLVLGGCGFSVSASGGQQQDDADVVADAMIDAMVDAAIDAPDASNMLLCPTTYTLNATTGSHYRVVTTLTTWPNARTACEADGANAHLVVANSAQEASVIGTLAPGETWVGLTDMATEATWVWIAPSTYTMGWVVGQPSHNNTTPDQDCGEYNGTGWHDDQCNVTQAYICECNVLSTTN